jgi:vacuolar-type H+-ATPase subunit C/Vma6
MSIQSYRTKGFFLISKFVYINAKLSAMGSPFLEEHNLDELMGLRSLSDFKSALNSHKDYNLRGENARDIQQELEKIFLAFMDLLHDESPKQLGQFWDAWIERIEVEKIKRDIFLLMSGEKLTERELRTEKLKKLELDLIHFQESGFQEKENEERIEELGRVLGEHHFPDEVCSLFMEKPFNRIKFESSLEKHAMDQVLNAPLPGKFSKLRRKFVLQMKDMLNLKVMVRAKELKFSPEFIKELLVGDGWELAGWKLDRIGEGKGIEETISLLEGTSWAKPLRNAFPLYLEEGAFSLELALDRAFMERARDLSIEDSLGMGPGLRFAVEKERENQNLRVICKAIETGLKPEKIRKLLVFAPH